VRRWKPGVWKYVLCLCSVYMKMCVTCVCFFLKKTKTYSHFRSIW
jgi:hypothetical protein